MPLAGADEIHRYLVEAFRIGNRARLRFARLLAALSSSRMYVQLGHPSITQYAERCFGVQRSETFELLRVAEIIDELPLCREAFEAGELCWSALKLITRVANAETEAEWLAFAKERSFAELRAEVQDAVRKNRDRPRADRYGLPNLTVRFTVELTREEQERLETALEKAGAEIAPALGEERLETKDVLLFLVERFLRTDPEGTPEGREERDDSPYVIVYHRCDTCSRARLMSADGPVEVPRERIDRVACDAAEEVLEDGAGGAGGGVAADGVDRAHDSDSAEAPAVDRPNSPALARRVKLRDGIRCQNPGCRQRGPLHAHHIEHRARGGRTVASNETAVCTTCHALIHAGLLEVTGDPLSGLVWRPRSSRLAVDFAPDDDALADVPVVRVESAIADSSGAGESGVVATGGFVTGGAADYLAELAGALEGLGLPKTQARARLERAFAELQRRGDDPRDEQKLLTLALTCR